MFLRCLQLLITFVFKKKTPIWEVYPQCTAVNMRNMSPLCRLLSLCNCAQREDVTVILIGQ